MTQHNDNELPERLPGETPWDYLLRTGYTTHGQKGNNAAFATSIAVKHFSPAFEAIITECRDRKISMKDYIDGLIGGFVVNISGRMSSKNIPDQHIDHLISSIMTTFLTEMMNMADAVKAYRKAKAEGRDPFQAFDASRDEGPSE